MISPLPCLAGNTTKGETQMPTAALIRPWNAAFATDDPAKGGCPAIPAYLQ
jgi:hypothetical protein